MNFQLQKCKKFPLPSLVLHTLGMSSALSTSPRPWLLAAQLAVRANEQSRQVRTALLDLEKRRTENLNLPESYIMFPVGPVGIKEVAGRIELAEQAEEITHFLHPTSNCLTRAK